MHDTEMNREQLVAEMADVRRQLAELRDSGGSQPERFADIRALLQAKMVELCAPSLAVAVARGGEVLWEEGFGWADRENRIPATPHTMYSLASISKPVTATGLMTLVEKGKVNLDTPINDYLGEAKLRAWVGDAKDATVRRVANHSSGLPLHFQFFYEDEPYRRPRMDETIRRYGNLVTIPGEHYQYSNLGYGVLDYVISRLSGKSYPDFMREEVFVPLGMTHASVNVGPGLEKHQAVRYGTDQLSIPFYDFDHPGGSAVYCSAHDLVRFGMFHLKVHLPGQKVILSDASLDEMQRTTMFTYPGDTQRWYGVGWSVRDDFGVRIVRHGGGMGGVRTELVLVPSEGLVIVVLCNAASELSDIITNELIYTLLPQCAPNRAAIEAKNKAEMAQFMGPFPQFQPVPELFGEWSGSVHTYKEDLPVTLRFKESGDIHFQLGDQPPTLVSSAVILNGYFTGRAMGDIGTEDANRAAYILAMVLTLRDQVMNGAMIALSPPGRRVRNALSHWMEVKKQS